MDWVEFFKGLFSFSIIIPASIMCYFPMKNQLRFSVKKIVLLLSASFVIIAPLSSYIMIACDIRTTNIVLMPDMIICFLLFKYTVKTEFARSMFVFLSVICLFSIFSLYVYEIEPFYKAEMDYGISSSFDLLFMAISLFFLGVLAFPLLKYYSWMIDNISYKNLWYAFMVLPITVLVTNMYTIPISYANLRVGKVGAKALILHTVVFLLYILVFVLFYIFSKTTLEKTKLEEQNFMLEMQTSYNETLQTYIKQTTKIRHDLKHSVHLAQCLLDEGDLTTLRKYIGEYSQALNITSPVRLCSSNAVNAVLNYYRQSAIDNEVDINWKINIPEHSSISEVDFCGILGNLSENAISGCKTILSGKKYFDLSIDYKGGYIYIVATNNFNGELKKTEKGYESTKHSGRGIGLRSMKNMAEIYGGFFEAVNTDDTFCVNMTLKYS